MAYSSFKNSRIAGIACCVPKNIQKTLDYPFFYTDKEKRRIIKTTGIEERRIAPENICASDLGLAAAEKLLTELKIKSEEIRGIVFLSQTPDYRVPFTSNILQHKLKITNSCLCVDINAGCNGFISGLQTSFSLLENMDEGKILFIVAETTSKMIAQKDKSTSLLFGDGGAAFILEKSDHEVQSYFSNFSDGKHYEAIIIPDGGFRNPLNNESLVIQKYEDGSERNNLEIDMDGPAVFDFTMREVVPSIREMHKRANISIENIDYFSFHQSNKFIIKQFINQLNIPSEKVLININRFGNTSGVSIPLTFVTEIQGSDLKKDKVHCCGYGAGLSWGNAILDLSETRILPLIEI